MATVFLHGQTGGKQQVEMIGNLIVQKTFTVGGGMNENGVTIDSEEVTTDFDVNKLIPSRSMTYFELDGYLAFGFCRNAGVVFRIFSTQASNKFNYVYAGRKLPVYNFID